MVIIAIVLFAIKIAAWFLTRSVAILTDALESTVNVIAGFIGWYSLLVAAKPSDADHPYGHGKAEFLSAGIEGTLIVIAGIAIVCESVYNFIYPHPIHKLDKGILLVGLTAIINFVVGWISLRRGRKNNSLALVASGKHLQSDTYSTLAIMAGLALIYATGLLWLDGVMGIIMAIIIMITGYRILRRSIAGIMDEADKELLLKMIETISRHRRTHWIDLHNLRVIKYGGQLHVDCHLTVPWFLSVLEAHYEIDELTALIRKEFGDTIEVFVHADACLDFSCPLCKKHDCEVRRHPFVQQLPWTLENVSLNEKHRLRQAAASDHQKN